MHLKAKRPSPRDRKTVMPSPDRRGNGGAEQGTEYATSDGSEQSGETALVDIRSPWAVPPLERIAGRSLQRVSLFGSKKKKRSNRKQT